eukprot:gnl/Dysnectes_brevis/603_a667_7181.p1 GENE.gnl/Dysnectes_brevis/603_a667_7181~~gnl/Dysnectes_brevis/603_a667_7181.p1  ORF type:complete len:211 (-),score=27.67 gnl/Dysnectes_brevis/603_a667_7181:59-661(-)
MATTVAESPSSLSGSLDEPVLTTIKRDLRLIGLKTKQVLWVFGGTTDNKDVYTQWDMWGPLIFSLLLCVLNSIDAPNDQGTTAFNQTFVMIFFGSVIVALNTALLGGEISFLGAISLLGYCLAPIALGSAIDIVIGMFFGTTVRIIIRVIVSAIALAWSVMATSAFFREVVPADKKLLGVYPVFLYYGALVFILLIADAD